MDFKRKGSGCGMNVGQQFARVISMGSPGLSNLGLNPETAIDASNLHFFILKKKKYSCTKEKKCERTKGGAADSKKTRARLESKIRCLKKLSPYKTRSQTY